jgi:hypothetical protein
MRITAKFSGGKCSEGCGFPIEKDNAIDYDPVTKTVRHEVCPTLFSGGHELAEKLGFLPHAEAAVKDWTKHDR